MWASARASLAVGLDGARRQAAEIEDALGVPTSSTSLAFIEALRALGIERVAVAATYPEPVTRYFVDLLVDAGLQPVGAISRGIPAAIEVGALDRDAVLRLVLDGNHPDAQAIVVPDTALHTAKWLGELEEAAGKPVLTANQVTVWQGLRLAGLTIPTTNLGTLFARRPADRAVRDA